MIASIPVAHRKENRLDITRVRDDGRPGYISVVVPEHDIYSADRNSSGVVLRLVESEAGVKNYRIITNLIRKNRGTLNLTWCKAVAGIAFLTQ